MESPEETQQVEQKVAKTKKIKETKSIKVKSEKPIKEKKEKKPRAYSFIDAYAEWRREKGWTGLCPKKLTDEYNEIKNLYDQKVQGLIEHVITTEETL
jgi:hypothetical protein